MFGRETENIFNMSYMLASVVVELIIIIYNYNPSLSLKVTQFYLTKVNIFTTYFGPTGTLSSAKTIHKNKHSLQCVIKN
jgi:hypothetical protein